MAKKVKKPSIKDIAKKAGVAISTVSHVINDTKFVSSQNREKVTKAIKELNYRPNILARSLRTKKTKTVAVITPDISQPFFAQTIRGMEEAARKRRYTLIIGCTFYDPKEEKSQTYSFLDQSIDGLVFFCGYDDYSHIEDVFDHNIPIVAADRLFRGLDIPSVHIDNHQAMIEAITYLHRLGHERIGYITFDYEKQRSARERYEGYCLGLERNGLEYNPDYVIIENSLRLDELKGTYELLRRLSRKEKMPTVFATLADFLAIATIKALKDSGFRVPEDISILGFNNEVISEFSDPPLTTVKQPKKVMGKIAMDLLIDMIEGKRIKEKEVILPTELIIRGSVSKLRVGGLTHEIFNKT